MKPVRRLLPLLSAAAAAMAAMFLLSACDPQRVAKLEEGVSTEAQVRKEFGEPSTVTVQPDGQRVLDYPRQPEGWTNYRITIGADGVMSSLKQLLHADNFARVQPGASEDQVRTLLGRPAGTTPWDRVGEVEVFWRFRPDPNSSKLFSVYFDRQGKVLRTATSEDPKAQHQASS